MISLILGNLFEFVNWNRKNCLFATQKKAKQRLGASFFLSRVCLRQMGWIHYQPGPIYINASELVTPLKTSPDSSNFLEISLSSLRNHEVQR